MKNFFGFSTMFEKVENTNQPNMIKYTFARI
jgi:hypothetical protein